MNFIFIPANKKNDLIVRYLVQLQGVCNKYFNDLSDVMAFVQLKTKKITAKDTVKKAILEKGYYSNTGVRIIPEYRGTCDICGCKNDLIRHFNYIDGYVYTCHVCKYKRSGLSNFNSNSESVFFSDEDEDNY